MDEPSSFLDFKHQRDLAELLISMRAQNIGIVLVLHDLNLISKIADFVILLQANIGEPSTICGAGSPHEIFKPDMLKLVYDVDIDLVKDPASNRSIFTHI